MTVTGRGEHDTETRVGDRERLLIMRHTSMTRAHCDEVLRDFAAAVRAEEREQIAQRIEAMPIIFTRDAHEMDMRDAVRRDCARLARGASE